MPSPPWQTGSSNLSSPRHNQMRRFGPQAWQCLYAAVSLSMRRGSTRHGDPTHVSRKCDKHSLQMPHSGSHGIMSERHLRLVSWDEKPFRFQGTFLCVDLSVCVCWGGACICTYWDILGTRLQLRFIYVSYILYDSYNLRSILCNIFNNSVCGTKYHDVSVWCSLQNLGSLE